MIKPRPAQQSAREFRRLAKAAVSLGIDFNGAAIGVDHALLKPIGDGLQRLSSALQELSEDLQREAMTPSPEPPPAPKPTPILDFLESREQAEAPPRPAEVVPERPGDGDEKKACDEPPATVLDAIRDTYAAFVGRNPLFTIEAYGDADAGIKVARVFPDRAFRFEAVTPQWAIDRKLPGFDKWKEATTREAMKGVVARAEAVRADQAHPEVPAEPGSDPGAAVSGPAPDTTLAVSGPSDPEVPSYPTESPRDPLIMLSVEELGLKASVMAKVQEAGIVFAAQLWDEAEDDDGFSAEDESYIRDKIQAWELARRKRIIADGSWLDEELTYAAFRMGDAPEFWGKMRERGATEAELRDAINKRFFAMGGVDSRHRAGYRFYSGPAPAFYLTSDKPSRDAEPVLEGKHLIDRVRQLLQIPTREEPPAKGDGKAKGPKQRKAVAR